MKHAIIFGHPNASSFTASVARTYGETVQACGQDVALRDLYRMRFAPCLQAEEIPAPGFAPAPDVAAERTLLADADVYVLAYPLWFNTPPAIVTGYLQRVFGMGFGYAPGLMGNRPLLSGRKLVVFTSSGAPTEWLQKEGGWEALRALFDAHFAAVCGLEVIEHRHFGHLTTGASKPMIESLLAQVASVAKRVAAGA